MACAGLAAVRQAVSMSTPIPPPLRAAAGLAALAIDSARKLPQQVVSLPVLAVSAALQASLKAQQRYAELVARGDEVLGQLRGAPEDAPAWAQFDDEPVASARPRSAFDAAPEPVAVDEDLLDQLAADELGGGEPEAVLLADAGLDAPGPMLEPDGVAATEAEAGGLDVGEALGDAAPGVDLPAGAVTGGALDTVYTADIGNLGESGDIGDVGDVGREPGSATEPGVDLPAGLDANAEAVEDALAESTGDAGPDALTDAAAGLDGYLAVEPPVARYDELSIPQLRGRLRSLTESQIEALVAYERATAARPPYLTMLENRLVTLRSR